jgi:hypothetical protein
MEWSEHKQRFVEQSPAPPPMIDVEIGVISLDGTLKKKLVAGARSCADSGCQTSTAGSDLLKDLNVKPEELLHTKHGILGITDSQLNVIGALTTEIRYQNAVSRQLLYIATNVKGVYLSETALKDLKVLPEGFPSAVSSMSTNASVRAKDPTDECRCLPRSSAPERPVGVPFPPTEQNKSKLKRWLIEAFASSGFNTCSHQKLCVMSGKPMDIVFKSDEEPYAVHTPIPIPRNWKERVKQEIDRDVRLGIIEPVPQGTPVKWCARMVVTPKKDGAPRRTVDLQRLKSATRRETHFTQTPFSIVSSAPKNSLKTVLDAWNGYHSLKLTENAKEATTFITEWGRYRYCRAPMGFHASGDAYTRRFDDITAGFERVSRCVDDSLLTDTSIEEAFYHTFDYLKLCSDNGIVFNEGKFVFAEEEVEFAGFIVTMDGYHPPTRITDAISGFPVPKSLTDTRAWFGLVNQVNYALAQCGMMAPFRELLLKNKRFYWDETLDRLFQNSKEKIVSLVKDGIKTFEMNRPTCLTTDWSKIGIGFTLCQKHCGCQKPWTPLCGNGHWKIVQAGSRFTTPSESRYSPPEGEALAVVYGLKQCRNFIMGAPKLLIAVDHKPLTRIFNHRALETIENPRLLRMKEKTMMYDFEIIHVPGKSNAAADAASRYPSKLCYIAMSRDNEPLGLEESSRAYAVMQSARLPSSVSWEDVNEEAKVDKESVTLKEIIQTGFPKCKELLPEFVRYFWPMKDDLYIIEDVVFKGRKMLIPRKLRPEVFKGLHASHQGSSTMALNARERLFWPNLLADLKITREMCRECTTNAPSQREEGLIITTGMEYPFQQVATDLCKSGGHTYLIYADRLSGWTEIEKLTTPNLRQVQRCMLRWFRTYGVPEEIASDGGPPYNAAEYDKFLRTWKIRKRLSSAYYPQSNGRAEAAVKSMKRILLNNIGDRSGDINTEEISRALLNQRNTPRESTELAPSEILFGKKIRDHLPSKLKELKGEWVIARQAREINSLKQMTSTNKSRKELPPLAVGDSVVVQNQTGNSPLKWSNTGTVVEAKPHRQYKIMVDGSRRLTLRNRRFVKKVLPSLRNHVLPPDIPFQAMVRADPPSAGRNKDVEPVADTSMTEDVEHSRSAPPVREIVTPEVHSITVSPVQHVSAREEGHTSPNILSERRSERKSVTFTDGEPRRSRRTTKGKAPKKLNL